MSVGAVIQMPFHFHLCIDLYFSFNDIIQSHLKRSVSSELFLNGNKISENRQKEWS